jgi:hypothetical protein
MFTLAAAAPIALEVHICDQRRSYTARFATEAQAMTFISDRPKNHVFSEVADEMFEPATFPNLYAMLYPTCEHGLSADLCEGPQHYGYDEDERRAYGF